MRFLTRDWHRGDLSEAEADAVELAFRTNRNRVLPQLPVRFQEFARTITIHDALVRSIRLDRRTARYDGVDLTPLDVAVLMRIAANSAAEALYDEVDELCRDAAARS